MQKLSFYFLKWNNQNIKTTCELELIVILKTKFFVNKVNAKEK